MNLLYVTALLPLYVLNCYCDKICSHYNSTKINLIYTILKFLLGSIILGASVILSNGTLTTGAVSCGILCAAMYTINKIVILTGYERSSVALMTLCHASGMIVPCVFGWIFLNEKFRYVSLLGMLLVIIAICIMKNDKNDNTPLSISALIIGLIVFLTSGGVMISQKLFAIDYAGKNVAVYNFISFIFSSLFVSAVYPVIVKKSINVHVNKSILFLCALCSAVSLVVISQVMTIMSAEIPSIILFPLFNGSGIILVTIMSSIIFKEKITIKKFIGVLSGIGALMLVTIK